jgi:KaiC/GvpD/RAD55 family RecA-like ATPase
MTGSCKQRILAWLAAFPPSMEKAWDVPRRICLPGIAEALGVVRSALHGPITELLKQELISERKAHVIAGGSRKRKVYHITLSGRESVGEPEVKRSEGRGKLYGKPPETVELKGRQEFIDELLSRGGRRIITGLPGIGKSVVLADYALQSVAKGGRVRFATGEYFSDLSTLLSAWQIEYSSPEAALKSIGNETLILDEIQELSSRHLPKVISFCNKVENIIIASRPPSPFPEDFEQVELLPLEIDDAIELLPEHLGDGRKMIAQRLGGHPLALQLHDEDSHLPEAGDDLLQWVSDVVLAGLSEAELNCVDNMALLPIPVPCEMLRDQDSIAVLDERALIRWPKESVELQHLVRNVRFADLDQSTFRKALDYWCNLPDDLARLIELHLRVICDEDCEGHLLANSEPLLVEYDSALAVLIEDALLRNSTPPLHRLAAFVAIERGESEIAKSHLQQLEAPDLDLRLALLEGRMDDVERIESKVEDQARMVVAKAVRALDDRLPRHQPQFDIDSIIESLDISTLDRELRPHILVALSHIRHAQALLEDDRDKAAQVRDELAAISSANDPQVQTLLLRSEISELEINEKSVEKIQQRIMKISGLKGSMLSLALVEKVESYDKEMACSILKTITIPEKRSLKALTASRRVAALIWTWRAWIGEGNQVAAMSEAISLWRGSGCDNAARELTKQLHELL